MMYEYHIKEMLDAIEEAISWEFTGSIRVEAEKALKAYWTDRIALVWSIEDVMETARNHNHTIYEDEARSILQIIHKDHNAVQGVNWDVIEICIATWCSARDSGEHLKTEIAAAEFKLESLQNLQVGKVLSLDKDMRMTRHSDDKYTLAHYSRQGKPLRLQGYTLQGAIDDLRLEENLRKLQADYSEKFNAGK